MTTESNVTERDQRRMSEITERDRVYFDLFITALEGGIGYWSECSAYHWTYDDEEGDDILGFFARIEDMEDGQKYKITRATIAAGVGKAYEAVKSGRMQNKYHRRAIKDLKHGDFEDLDYDAETADYIVQCGLFGEAVYG